MWRENLVSGWLGTQPDATRPKSLHPSSCSPLARPEPAWFTILQLQINQRFTRCYICVTKRLKSVRTVHRYQNTETFRGFRHWATNVEEMQRYGVCAIIYDKYPPTCSCIVTFGAFCRSLLLRSRVSQSAFLLTLDGFRYTPLSNL